MTEEEAKKKWCPFYQVNGGTDADDNRSTGWDKDKKIYAPTLRNATCLASQCMAWRFTNLDVTGDPITNHGFCGLAGKP